MNRRAEKAEMVYPPFFKTHFDHEGKHHPG